MSMHENIIEIFDRRRRLVIKVPLAKNRTFKVNLNTVAIQCLSSTNVEEESWKWHYRFRHLNFKSLNLLSSKELVKGIPLISAPEKVCEGCAMGKQTRSRFKKTTPKRAKQPLEVVHSDVCGPFETATLGVKIFRTDGGEEFNSGDMNNFCLKGRTFHTISAYLLNRCPTKALLDCTPEEEWTGIKPSVVNLKIFGSVFFRHIPDEKRRKLADKSETYILVGYHPTGAHRLYSPKKNEIMVSRDVLVDESATFNWVDAEPSSTSESVVSSWLEDKKSEGDKEASADQNADNRRSCRTRFPSTRLAGHEVFADSEITDSGEIMLRCCNGNKPLKSKWKNAMVEELKAIKKSGTWIMMELPKHKQAIERHEVDYTDVFALVARIETVRLVVAITNIKGWEICQMDVKLAFLNDPLEEEKGEEVKVFKLNKALYGLRQALRACNARINAWLIKNDFQKCTVEFGVYVKQSDQQGTLLICLYVDDLLITSSKAEAIDEFKTKMKGDFEMTDLGSLGYFLGLEFLRTHEGMFVHQKRYIGEILKRFGMESCNSVSTPVIANIKLDLQPNDEKVDTTLFKQIVGSLRYVCNSRPDICYSAGLTSRFMGDPRQTHLSTAKHILRYLKGTIEYGLFYPKRFEGITGNLEAWSDSDWCGDQTDRRSTFGYVFKYMGSTFSWCSKKQSVVALSSCEAEYIASFETACQSAWLEIMLEELTIECCRPIQLWVDNKSAINLVKNPVSHGRSKHIETRFHYLREQVNKRKLEMMYCSTEDQTAHIFTKTLCQTHFEKLRDKLGVKDFNTFIFKKGVLSVLKCN
ncbi:hypothetical protein V8G54_029165 [Vigna mungo]|uniref:Retrovirus-related Pol polyprotein from transposon TNT 1-94 n=1 Tax=Vigna mungo TaxID=3915 RepID=A0AAQ3MSV0_VIGMU